MRRRFLAILVILTTLVGSRAMAQLTDTYFPYPVVPEEKTLLSERCNYLVDKFWEGCNLKQSFSNLERLDKAFSDWIGFMPYATADTVFMSIDNFLTDVNKLGPSYLLTVGKMAEKHTYTDSCEVYSEMLYLPFAKAVAANKKIDKAEHAHFERQARVIENSGLNQNVPSFSFTKPDGTQSNLGEVIASRVVLFFTEPDCFDCTLAKARLSADYNLGQLIDRGLVKIVAIYPGKPNEKWQAESASYPDNWVVGASEEVNDYFDFESQPTIYYMDAKRKVLGKDVSVEALMLGLRQINQQMQ